MDENTLRHLKVGQIQRWLTGKGLVVVAEAVFVEETLSSVNFRLALLCR